MTSASCGSSPSSSPRGRLARPSVSRIRKVDRLLGSLYGPQAFPAQGDPLGVLIQTILSQNTSDTNSWRAFLRLRERFPTWEMVADADPEEIEGAISVGGLGAIKSLRIKQVLNAIEEDSGSYSLDFLKAMSPQAGLEYLCSLDGVGIKTASCVLLFAFGMPVFPVDTHVNRLAQRLGWLPLGTNAEKAAVLLDRWVPPDVKYSLHLNLIAHGRALCQARSPKCPVCILLSLCPRVGLA